MYMKDEDVLFLHINIMLRQAMKQREWPCHDDDEDEEVLTILALTINDECDA